MTNLHDLLTFAPHTASLRARAGRRSATTALGLGKSADMPQDSRARNREKRRRAKKNALWEHKRAAENAEADKPKAAAKKAS